MNEYFKDKQKIKEKKDIEFQIIEWNANDLGQENDNDNDPENEDNNSCNEVYTMTTFGRTNEGHSISCKITDFTPFYYVKVPERFDRIKKDQLVSELEKSFQLMKKVDDTWVNYYSKCLIKSKCILVEKKDLFGYNHGKKFKFLRLVFNNYTAMIKSRYFFKNPIKIPSISNDAMKFKLYESNVEPFMRYCHIQDILMAGWIKLPKEKYKYTSDNATTQIEVEIHWKEVISLKEKQNMANFLQASWDIETYSFDGAFPDPNKIDTSCKSTSTSTSNVENTYPNVIYQIATTYKYQNDTDTNTIVKHLLTLKDCDPIDNVVVEICKTEKELIKKWIDTISKMDPDVLYTYNGDTFDCMYLYERAKLYKLDNYLNIKLSRLNNIPTNVKKETFSSSAYGDSDFVRFYIPGRLNYDLLIHYKRGMKKYPSYKLDYIANQILKEGKNDVSVKEIFSHYKSGKSDLIKKIGEYCVQDTELLQKLVDKQLILITIVQLANVTYVPIGYLVTRGQTIKVFSQVLRKARQMEFLVPHTNFNEDSFPIAVKCKNAHNFEKTDINKYVEIKCGRIKNSYGKLITINGKISEIVDDTEFIVLSNTEIDTEEQFTSKYIFKNKEYQINRLYPVDETLDNTFTGASVLTAIPGIHQSNIAVLDFASLYPTCEISRNLCYSTMIMDPKYLPKSNQVGVFEEFCEDTQSTIKYERFKWDDKIEYTLNHTCVGVGKSGKSKGQICGKQAFFEIKNGLTENMEYFCRIHDPLKKSREESEKFQKKDISYEYVVVQTTTNNDNDIINKGVIPALLEELYAERKKVKKLMGKAHENNDKLLEDILNSTQLAIKVSLNSVYGFVSRGQGNLILKPLGQLTTYIGRTLIKQSQEYAEGDFLKYIKESSALMQKIEYNKEILKEIPEEEKDIILEQFKI